MSGAEDTSVVAVLIAVNAVNIPMMTWLGDRPVMIILLNVNM